MEKLTKLKRERDNSTLIVGDLTTPLTITNRRTRQKINRETGKLIKKHSTQQQQHTHFSQEHRDLCPEKTVS